MYGLLEIVLVAVVLLTPIELPPDRRGVPWPLPRPVRSADRSRPGSVRTRGARARACDAPDGCDVANVDPLPCPWQLRPGGSLPAPVRGQHHWRRRGDGHCGVRADRAAGSYRRDDRWGRLLRDRRGDGIAAGPLDPRRRTRHATRARQHRWGAAACSLRDLGRPVPGRRRSPAARARARVCFGSDVPRLPGGLEPAVGRGDGQLHLCVLDHPGPLPGRDRDRSGRARCDPATGPLHHDTDRPCADRDGRVRADRCAGSRFPQQPLLRRVSAIRGFASPLRAGCGNRGAPPDDRDGPRPSQPRRCSSAIGMAPRARRPARFSPSTPPVRSWPPSCCHSS